MFSTRRRPHLNEDKREGDPTAAEAEDGFGLPEFGQIQIAHLVNYVRSILKQDCSIDAILRTDETCIDLIIFISRPNSWRHTGVVRLLVPWAQTFQGVAVDDREEDGVEEKDEGRHGKAEVLAPLSCLLSPKSYGGELSKHSKEDVTRRQVLQALQAGQLQDQENSEGKTKGQAEPRVEQVSVSYESQGEDSEESR